MLYCQHFQRLPFHTTKHILFTNVREIVKHNACLSQSAVAGRLKTKSGILFPANPVCLSLSLRFHPVAVRFINVYASELSKQTNDRVCWCHSRGDGRLRLNWLLARPLADNHLWYAWERSWKFDRRIAILMEDGHMNERHSSDWL